ncbi:MAG: transcriptional regulator BetI [Roseibium album]|uniref:HTH-type transcriptional regulator BetI n=1 Tax=Roseibium album TaxID=311410 RepID=A0A0M7AYX7_9HYPH|nr:transcriptional regulator BetI [Roseibium album]MBG6154806.1 TetR/AcrR family transcriptional repressor of bet genes [Labrenzia sp. EL_162]MBG6162063.1 TetR/AcrR family transcriptional repressor of bet genes [Labrenzia sp. EL_195]MBG6193064.1 TetR/AcrR family transcriptional repressor of bet genes [Labrenzia sp. EL_159]MBG6199451.1 TetR/AcrR family transcriptional repressor of bet genes [Labrenzia sp. EL_13]MBG6209536.1 TetR/AcrR family transcriptional repressor of bet genes [Labrenzia sp. 
MPKVGMEAERRRSLIDATVDAIHERGYSDITMAQIAKRAGVSGGLVHHYFGSKDQLLAATMRHLLTELGRAIRDKLAKAETPRERISAIIAGNFAIDQFQPAVIAAWLAFYVQSRTTDSNNRLLRIYAARLASNLTHNLRSFMPQEEARRIAEGTASMIDGVWIRQALSGARSDHQAAIAMVEDYVETQIAALAGRTNGC